MDTTFRKQRTKVTLVAIAIAFALGTTASASAQYTYPGTASSSGKYSAHYGAVRSKTRAQSRAGQSGNNDAHMANGIHPIRARDGHMVGESAPQRRGNPSMQAGESCPIGSPCGPHATSSSGSMQGSSDYGHGTEYGKASTRHPASAAQRATNRTPAGEVQPSIGQSRTGVGSQAPTKSQSQFGYQYGQTGATTITGANGKKTTLGGAQTITGPNGKIITAGGAAPTSFRGPDGAMHGTTNTAYGDNSVNAQGDHTGGIHMDNGGMAGNSNGKVDQFDDTHHIDTATGKPVQNKPTPGSGNADANDGTHSFWHSLTGGGSSSAKSKKVEDPRKVQFTKTQTGGVGDDPDVGSGGQGGTLVSGTGKGINPGHRPGQDSGGGNRPDGAADNGGGSQRNNATGAYIVTNKNGQDIPVKPKEVGALHQSYNGKNGVIDPKQTAGSQATHNGGG